MSILTDSIPECQNRSLPDDEGNLPEIESAVDLLADKTLQIPPQIIVGVLHQGSKAVLGGSSKARKTWILLDLALSVASGRPWWIWATTQGKVLYINFEIQRAFIRERLKTLCEKKGIKAPDNLHLWNLRGKAAPLGELEPKLVAKIAEGSYSLVIIDPIYKGLGGRDENSAGDISELCNELERIAVQTGAAVMYAAHFSKGNQAGKEAMDRISGSGVWARDADSIITLTKHKEEQANAYTVDLILRNQPEQDSFVVAWEFPLMTLRDDLNPDDLKQARGRKKTHEEADVLEILGTDCLSTKEWQKRAENEGISSSTFYRLYKQLKISGRVAKRADEKWESRPTRVSFANEKTPKVCNDDPVQDAGPIIAESQAQPRSA